MRENKPRKLGWMQIFAEQGFGAAETANPDQSGWNERVIPRSYNNRLIYKKGICYLPYGNQPDFFIWKSLSATLSRFPCNMEYRRSKSPTAP